jgi:hypothetical protein
MKESFDDSLVDVFLRELNHSGMIPIDRQDVLRAAGAFLDG